MIAIFFFATLELSPQAFFNVVAIAVFLIWFRVYSVRRAAERRRFRAISIANIDYMSGVEFEIYLQKLLTTQGYSARTTTATGDLGVDLIASNGVDRIAIQAKRCSTRISRRAVSDAVAGMNHYRCNKAMVITNNYFTKGAMTLAQSNPCVLIDRDTLGEWIVQMQGQPCTRDTRNGDGGTKGTSNRHNGPWNNW